MHACARPSVHCPPTVPGGSGLFWHTLVPLLFNRQPLPCPGICAYVFAATLSTPHHSVRAGSGKSPLNASTLKAPSQWLLTHWMPLPPAYVAQQGWE